MNSEKFSISDRLRSFRFAFDGLRSMLRHEHNSRIHLLAAVSAIILGLILRISLTEWAILIVVTGLVFIAELLNSAIETLADLIDTKPNERIKRAKDYGAAAVLISAIIAVAVGVLIFVPKLLHIVFASSGIK
jgi:diacylglycerol kinase